MTLFTVSSGSATVLLNGTSMKRSGRRLRTSSNCRSDSWNRSFQYCPIFLGSAASEYCDVMDCTIDAYDGTALVGVRWVITILQSGNSFRVVSTAVRWRGD